MKFHGEGIAGCIFLTCYTVNFSILMYGYITRRIVLGSVFSFLLFHVCIRLAAQSISIVIGTVNLFDNIGLLVAYLVLSAEGYFSLVLCAYRFLVHHHQHAYPIDGSWLEGRAERGEPMWRRFRAAMTARNTKGEKEPWVMTWIHWLLIGANTIIIVGGSTANGGNTSGDDYEHRLHEASIMRTVGQAIFLVINLFLGVFLFISRNQDRNPRGTLPQGWSRFFRVKPDLGEADVMSGPPGTDGRNLDGYVGRMHPTLLVLCIAWPPLIIRGIFGLLQSQIVQINYANVRAYDEQGFTDTFIIFENVFAVLPEWTACCLLCATMFTRESFNPKHDSARIPGDSPMTEDKALKARRSAT